MPREARLTALPPTGRDHREAFAADVLHGLSAVPKRLPSKYFYDDLGVRLYEEIMGLPEYGLVRAEDGILAASGDEIVERLGRAALDVIDLGSGDGTKTRILLRGFLSHGAEMRYVPVDISRDTIERLSTALARETPELHVHGVAGEYFDALRWLRAQGGARKLVLFLGSNIGNFLPGAAVEFLRAVRMLLTAADHFLLGADLVKEPRSISRAYDDASGVTAKFNLNLLTRINRELDADFDLDAWSHYAYYDAVGRAARSVIVSRRAQRVRIRALGAEVPFAAWETIHTEDSHKYTLTDIERLAAESGFAVVNHFVDETCGFVDSLWKVV